MRASDGEGGGAWKNERTFSTIERDRTGLPSLPRAGDALGDRAIPLPLRAGPVPGTGMGSDADSSGLGSTDDTDEHRDGIGGESRLRASGLWTSTSSSCTPPSAPMRAMAV